MHNANLSLHKMRVHNAAVDSATYGAVLAANVRAARARASLGQETVAARMRALGYAEWRYQTVGVVEKGKRRLGAEEVLALAEALGTTVFALMRPAEDDGLIRFPSGAAISARSVALSAVAHNDGAVTWDGNEPRFSPDSGDVTAQVIIGPRFPPPPEGR